MYLKRGISYARLDDHQPAIADFSEAVKLNPQYSQAYAERGYIRMMTGQNQAAIQDFDRAIHINPQCIRAYYGRGAVRSYSGDYEGAIEDFMQEIRLSPSANAHYNFGGLFYLQGAYVQTIKNLTITLSSEPNWAFAYYLRGNAFYEIGDEPAAVEDFHEAVKIEAAGTDEKSPVSIRPVFIPYYPLPGFTINIGKSNRLAPDDEHGFYARGLAQYRMGNQEQAIRDLQYAAEVCLKHQNRPLHQRLLDLLKEIEPFDED